jgi:GT2 family glycosyltransferase
MNKKIPSFSIVIPSWFTKTQHGKYGEHETFWMAHECLMRLLEVTPRNQYDFELIIINNGSELTDDDIIGKKNVLRADSEVNSLPLVSNYFLKADNLIVNETNLGFAPSMNQGFGDSSKEFIVALNNDILVWENWIDVLINEFINIENGAKTDRQDFKKPGAIMPALLKQTKRADEAILIKEIDLTQNYDHIGFGAEFGSLWVTRKSILDELKEKDGCVFDEEFKLGMGEDRDLWDRMRLNGYETYRTHKTRVFHQGNMTIGKVKNRKEYTFANREYLEKKRILRGKKYDK